jgi:hypothetical protein
MRFNQLLRVSVSWHLHASALQTWTPSRVNEIPLSTQVRDGNKACVSKMLTVCRQVVSMAEHIDR